MATEVNVNLKANTKSFDRAIDKSTSNVKELDQVTSDLTKASAVAFAGLSATIGLTTRKFAQFDNELRGVKTLLNENSFGAKGLEEGFNELRKDALKLGADSAVGLSELNKALFDTISAGVDASESIEVLGATSRLAVAGITDVSTATDGVTSALGAYGFAASEANNIAAKFFAAQVEGKTTIEELSSSVGLVAATASSAGVSFDELLASVSAATTAGIRTRSAFTGLKAAISNIAKPTEEAKEEAKRLGVEFSAAALRSKGLEGFLKSLTEANGFTKDSITRLFGSIEAQNIIFSLAGNQADKFQSIVKKLGDEEKNAAQFAEAFNTQNASLSNSFTRLSNKFDAVIIQLGEQFAPSVARGIDLVSDFLDTLAENESLLAFGASIIGTAAALAGLASGIGTAIIAGKALATALIPLNIALGGTLSIVTALSAATGIGLLVGGVVLLTKAFSDAAEADRQFNKELNSNGQTVEGQTKKVEELADAFRKVGLEAAGISQKPLIFLDEGAPATLKEALDVTDSIISGIERIPLVNEKIQAELDAQAAERKQKQQAEKEEALETEQREFEEKLEKIRERKQLENETIDEFNRRKFEAEKNLVEKAEKDKLKTTKSAIKTNKQLEQEDQKRRIGEFNKENALRVKDRINSNKSIADANAAFRTKEFKQTQQIFANLATLTQSSNKTLFQIGKIAAISSAIINTAQGATKALAQGGILGPVLAASVVAAGAVQLATIKNQQFTGAAKGGLLTGGIPGKDSIPVLAQDQELISPARNFEEVIGSVRAKREAERIATSPTFEEREPQQIDITIGFTDNAFEIIEQKIVERRTLNIGLI